jgi:hypothetical protein
VSGAGRCYREAGGGWYRSLVEQLAPRIAWLTLVASVAGGCENSVPPASTSGSSGSAAGPADCKERMEFGPSCTKCAEEKCCDEVAACSASWECMACMQPSSAKPDVCNGALDVVDALTTCLETTCRAQCPLSPLIFAAADPECDVPPFPSFGSCVTVGDSVECNPVTSAGCDTDAGASCDSFDPADKTVSYSCYPAGNVREVCEPCGFNLLDFCSPGNTCAGTCARYCCDDGDCGPGECDFGWVYDLWYGKPPTCANVGICVKRATGTQPPDAGPCDGGGAE